MKTIFSCQWVFNNYFNHAYFIIKLSLLIVLIDSCKKEGKVEDPTIGQVEIVSLTQESVSLKASVPSTAQEVGFCMSESTDPDLNNSRVVTAWNNRGIAEITIAELETGTQYFIRAYAKVSGSTFYSPNAQIITRSNGTTMPAEVTGIYTATIKAKLQLIADMPVEYWFVYGINNFNESTEKKNVSGSEEIIVTENLSELIPGTNHQVKIMISIDNQEFAGEVIHFKTLGAKPEITDLMISLPDTTSIAVSIKVESNLVPTEVELQYWVTHSPITIQTISCGLVESGQKTINTDFPVRMTLEHYSFKIIAKNGVGTSNLDTNSYSAAFTKGGITYGAVPFGEDFWVMTENYRGTHFNNGEEIPYIYDSIAWNELSTAGMAYYDHSDSLAKEFGALYNWYALADERGMSPEGWRLPTIYEIEDILQYYGWSHGSHVGGWMKETGYKYWLAGNIGADNRLGFNGRGHGYRDADGGPSFEGLREYAGFWSSSDFGLGIGMWGMTSHSATLYTAGITNYKNGNGVRFVKER